MSQQVLNEVAAQPTNHSWMQKIMAIKSQEKADKVEEALENWVESRVLLGDPETVRRIIMEAWPILMEKEAFKKWKETSLKSPITNLLIPQDEAEAVEIGAQAWMATEDEKSNATIAMLMLMTEEKMPQILSKML